MLLSYFFPNDLIVIFLKYNSDFYWGKKKYFQKVHVGPGNKTWAAQDPVSYTHLTLPTN